MAVERAGIPYFNIEGIRRFSLPNLRLPFRGRELDEIILGLTAVKPEGVHANGQNGSGHNGKVTSLDRLGHPLNGRLNGHSNGHHPSSPPEGEDKLSTSDLKEKIASTNKESSAIQAEITPIRESRLAELAEFEAKQQLHRANVKTAKAVLLSELTDFIITQGDSRVQLKRMPKDPDPAEAARKARKMQERKALPIAKRLYRGLKKGTGEYKLSDLPEMSIALFESIDEESKQLRVATRKASAARRAARNWDIWTTYLGGQLVIEGYWAKLKNRREKLETQLAELGGVSSQSYLHIQYLLENHQRLLQTQSALRAVDEEISNIIPKEILTGKLPGSPKETRALAAKAVAHSTHFRQLLGDSPLPQDELQTEYDRLLSQVKQLQDEKLSTSLRAVLLTFAVTMLIAKGGEASNISTTAIESFFGKLSQPQLVKLDSPPHFSPRNPLLPGFDLYQGVLTLPNQITNSQSGIITESSGFVYDKVTGILIPSNGREAAVLMNQMSSLSDAEVKEFLAKFATSPVATLSPLPTASEKPTVTPKPPTATPTPRPSPTANGTATVEAQTGERTATAIASATAKAEIDNATATAAAEIRNTTATAETVNATATAGARRDATSTVVTIRGATAIAASQAAATAAARATTAANATAEAQKAITAARAIQDVQATAKAATPAKPTAIPTPAQIADLKISTAENIIVSKKRIPGEGLPVQGISITAAQIRAELMRYGSRYFDQAQFIYDAGVRHNVDPAFIMAVWRMESTYHTAGGFANNPGTIVYAGENYLTGMTRGLSGKAYFPDIRQGIEAIAALIAKEYYPKGKNTTWKIHSGHYEGDPHAYHCWCHIGTYNTPTRQSYIDFHENWVKTMLSIAAIVSR